MKKLAAFAAFAAMSLCASSGMAQQVKTTSANVAADISLELISLDPASGSTLKANEPITVRFKYKYGRPYVGLRFWAKILDETYGSTYQGAIDDTPPGTGVVERYVLLTEPGEIKTISLVVKDTDHRQIYSRDFPVSYKYVRNPDAEATKNDGVGSRIANVRFAPMPPATLNVGATIKADLDYDIKNSAGGLDMWIEPLTNCNMTYSGMTGPVVGTGTIRKTFSVGEPCRIKKVKVTMVNAASQNIFEKVIDVDFKFIK